MRGKRRVKYLRPGDKPVTASNWQHFDFEEIVAETDKALLIRFEDGREEWMPLSQIADPDSYKKGDRNGTISLTDWIVHQKGL